MLLAIDTATHSMSLALHDNHTLIGEQTWQTGNRHNTLLAPSIAHLLHVCNTPMADVTMVAVATGPGSYTGLRIGIAMAKGIASVRQLPLIGISTMDVLAAGQPFHNTRHRLIAVVRAGRGRIICATYRVKKGRWTCEDDPQITNWEAVLEHLEDASYYITGEVSDAGRDAIEAAKAQGKLLTLVGAAHRARRAGFLAQEAWRRYHEGQAQDFLAAKLLPAYLNAPG